MSKTRIFTENNVDEQTGEITPTRWITKEVKNQEHFMRTYIQDLGVLAKCSKAEQSVVLCCLKYVSYSTNELLLNSSRRKELVGCTGLSINTINTAISRLYKKNIFVKDITGNYLNPKLFFYGTDLDRSKIIDLTLRYIIKE